VASHVENEVVCNVHGIVFVMVKEKSMVQSEELRGDRGREARCGLFLFGIGLFVATRFILLLNGWKDRLLRSRTLSFILIERL